MTIDAKATEATALEADNGVGRAAGAGRDRMEMVRGWAPLVLLTAFGVWLLLRLWGRVGDLLVDLGRELYLTQQIAQGRVLYRDMAYLYGPLSPYLNAGFWFVLGGGERAILYGNVAILMVTCVLLYRLLVTASDRYAATVAMAFFLGCGAFCASVRITNYNFLTPYSYGTTQGFALGVGAMAATLALHRTRRAHYALLSGALVGLSFLTKPETLLAAGAAAGVGLVVIVLAEPHNARRARFAGAFVAGAIVPALAGLGLLMLAMPFADARDAWLNGWLHIGKFTDLPIFIHGMGREDVPRNAWKVVRYACLYGQFVLPLFLAAILFRRALCARPRIALVVSLLVAAGLFALTQHYPFRPRFWLDMGRGLPVLPVIGAVVGLVAVRRPPEATARGLALLMLAVFSGALVSKLWLNARLFHYGFVLGTPAALIGIVLATGWLADVVQRAGGYAPLVRIAATGPILGVIVWQQSFTSQILAERTVPVKTPSGLMKLTHVTSTAADALDALRRLAAPGDTLAVFPDAAGLNFAAGMYNPGVYDVVQPLPLNLFGEATVTRQYVEHPPDFIILLNKDAGAYGTGWFGKDYARDLARWMGESYAGVETFGKPGEGRLRIQLFHRRGPATAPTSGPAGG